MSHRRDGFVLDYIALYAGDSPAEAEKLRGELRGEFPNAEVKKMTAKFGTIEQ